MKIIEIKALENGGHRNQTIDSVRFVPEGWAAIPEDMETPNFPFGSFETKDEDVKTLETVIEIVTVDGQEVEQSKEVEKVIATIKVVSKWTPGTLPEQEPEPEPEPTTEELLNIILGVDE